MVSRRLFLSQFLMGLLAGCATEKLVTRNKLVIGIVSYGEGNKTIDQYGRFQDYLATQTNTLIELEPAFNEVKALEQIQRHNWSLVFATPGLAAVAISQEKYLPLFSMEGSPNLRSVLVVRKDSPVQKILDLQNQAIALGQIGSATGYYLPIYELYGLKLAEILFAPTPKAILEMVNSGEVAAGAVSKTEYDRFSSEFGQQKFRILPSVSQGVPPGMVLLSPTVERNLQEQIVTAMKSASPTIIAEAGYITNVPPPDYTFLIEVVKRVKPIVTRIRQKPAPLYEKNDEKK
ncbi:ABC-type phosphate/phosphonate transport system, periplasmic component [Synechococcus sp. PCC 7502]|uniref:phosphate/phosphite/phosphonate ABC transporter substrate-binding protein n=1 Tax=Synechococcus sp. PCC 7502 TaxID=1173263 RepID=UPI00029FBA24|nr:PhnD/SsuA/transferrin family substrate-binding protein [Synechococcus sp. PCC 7502]AFY73967.1 ABC-type phosphate/phosphonate transport system, periplasmic component [Synechococcus sp. PCC 7502]